MYEMKYVWNENKIVLGTWWSTVSGQTTATLISTSPSGIMMAGRAAAPPLRGHMHLEGLESRNCALNYSRTAHAKMWFDNVIWRACYGSSTIGYASFPSSMFYPEF